MSAFKLTTPVLFLVFNRPDTTKQVYAAIRQAKPEKLFVAADGPRSDRPGEAEKCDEVQQIATNVDWDCDVKILFKKKNFGCGVAVSSGIDWFFENVEAGIILEDDCVPHQTFFQFCQELLLKYRHDERIMVISGNNFQFGRNITKYSYYYSRYMHCWGWASWRRAWKYYDFDMALWPTIRDSDLLEHILHDKKGVVLYWKRILDRTYRGEVDSWAYRWLFSCWVQNGLTILPNVNFVSNIGFGEDAVHTKDSSDPFANMRVYAMEFPLKHPPFMIRNARADEFTHRKVFSTSIYKLFVMHAVLD